MSYYEPVAPPPPVDPPVDPPARSPLRGAVSALVVALAVAVAGVLLGLAWYLLAPPLPLRKVEGGMAYTAPDPEQVVAQDGWFTILGMGFGSLAAVIVWLVATRHRGPIQLLAVVIGAVGAGYLAWKVGIQIGLDDYRQQVAAAPLGTIVERPIELSASLTKTCVQKRCLTMRAGDILVPALGATIGYALMAGWSRWPGLRPGDYDEQPQPLQPPMPPQPYGPSLNG